MKECVAFPAVGRQRCVQEEHCHLCNLKLFVYWCLLAARPRTDARLIDKCVWRPNKKGPRRPVG